MRKHIFPTIIIIHLFINLDTVSVCSTLEELIKDWMLELNSMFLQYTDFNFGPTDILKNTYASSIIEHLINKCDCSKNFTVDLFSILS